MFPLRSGPGADVSPPLDDIGSRAYQQIRKAVRVPVKDKRRWRTSCSRSDHVDPPANDIRQSEADCGASIGEPHDVAFFCSRDKIAQSVAIQITSGQRKVREASQPLPFSTSQHINISDPRSWTHRNAGSHIDQVKVDRILRI